MKTLIAYFSHVGENVADNKVITLIKGNTEILAEKIHALVGGDLYKIEEENPYPFSYRECNMRAKREDEYSEKPELKDKVGLDVSQYETIYLGFPIWYRTYPRIISTFITSYNLEGKTIIPFCTNDEGYFGIAQSELQGTLKKSNVKDGLSIRGVNVENSDDQIKKFIEANK